MNKLLIMTALVLSINSIRAGDGDDRPATPPSSDSSSSSSSDSSSSSMDTSPQYDCSYSGTQVEREVFGEVTSMSTHDCYRGNDNDSSSSSSYNDSSSSSASDNDCRSTDMRDDCTIQ